jgi:starch synthase
MAHQVYAGSDAFLMPSNFEPCGLGQMIAMRYGTVPVVRATGGLRDTVFEGLNGFVFERKSVVDLDKALSRAITTYNNQDRWNSLVDKGMTTDFGWADRADAYLRVYERAKSERPQWLVAGRRA